MAGRVSLILEKKAVFLNALAVEYRQYVNDIELLDKPLLTASFFNAFSRRISGFEQKLADSTADWNSSPRMGH
jgi:hypothetical protein